MYVWVIVSMCVTTKHHPEMRTERSKRELRCRSAENSCRQSRQRQLVHVYAHLACMCHYCEGMYRQWGYDCVNVRNMYNNIIILCEGWETRNKKSSCRVWEASLFSSKTVSEKWLKNWSAENCKVWGKNNRIDNKE